MFCPKTSTFYKGKLAMAKPNVGSASEFTGVLKDLFRQIDDGSISLFNLRAFLEHQNPFDYLVDINWQKVYQTLGMLDEYENFTKTRSAEEDPNLWEMPVVKGITCNKVVAAMRKLDVKFYLYADNLDKAVTKNDRDPSNGSYIIGFRRMIEADEENKNLSANELTKRNHKGITLLERLLLELGYFLATGKHLDESNVTLCTGSRYSDDYVPRVSWHSDYRTVYVGWYDPDGSDGLLRSRSAVSLPA